MRVLIASDGKTLGSTIAKRFGHARWYLIVDLETGKVVTTQQNVNREDHHDVVAKAAGEGVTAILTGNIGPRSYELISLHELQVAHAKHMTVQEALDRFRAGGLKILDAPTVRRNVEEHAFLMQGRRQQFRKGGRSRAGWGSSGGQTPRGQHHLQQYAGRGH